MRLQIKVFLNSDAFHQNKCIFERIVDLDLSICIPFQSLIQDFKYLFGQHSCVTFSVLS